MIYELTQDYLKVHVGYINIIYSNSNIDNSDNNSANNRYRISDAALQIPSPFSTSSKSTATHVSSKSIVVIWDLSCVLYVYISLGYVTLKPFDLTITATLLEVTVAATVGICSGLKSRNLLRKAWLDLSCF